MTHYQIDGTSDLNSVVNDQGRIQNFAKGGSWLMAMVYIVCSTMSMQSMLMLGGSGGMPPQENLNN